MGEREPQGVMDEVNRMMKENSHSRTNNSNQKNGWDRFRNKFRQLGHRWALVREMLQLRFVCKR